MLLVIYDSGEILVKLYVIGKPTILRQTLFGYRLGYGLGHWLRLGLGYSLGFWI